MFNYSIVERSICGGLIILDEEQKVIHWSDGAADLLGIGFSAANGKPVSQVLSEGLPYFSPPEFLDELIKAVGSPADFPGEVRGRINLQNPLELRISVFRSTISRYQFSVALILQDITKALEADQLRDILIKGLSHDMLEHITAVVGWADLMRRENCLSRVQIEGLDIIFRRGQQLAQTTWNLTTALIMNSDEYETECVPLDLAEILVESVSLVFPSTSFHSVRIDFEPDLPRVLANADMLKIVSQNLLENATRYSPPGSVVTLSARHDHPSEKVVVSISDQGEGLEILDLESIFCKHREAGALGSQQSPSIGLGLYIVKQFVKQMGGEVWVDSEPGVGANFCFSLPIAPS